MFEKEYKVPSLEAPSSRGGRWTVGLYCVTSYIPVDLSLSTIFFFTFHSRNFICDRIKLLVVW